MRLITRRRFVAGLGVGAVALGGNAFVIEPRRVVVSRHRIGSPASEAAHAPLRLVQITDLHLQRMSGHTRKIARTINGLEPDIVVFTGDMIDKADRVGELRHFLSLLDKGSSKYASLGNWEHWGRIDLDELASTYAAAGCRLLINETAVHEHSGHGYLITGLDDFTGGHPDVAAALHNIAPQREHIVLAHSPVYRDVLAKTLTGYPLSCVLSGHTHGGQVALFGWAPVRPAGSGRYVRGWYRESWPALYVSRGLGTSVAPVRFGAPPEIAYFEWTVPS